MLSVPQNPHTNNSWSTNIKHDPQIEFMTCMNTKRFFSVCESYSICRSFGTPFPLFYGVLIYKCTLYNLQTCNLQLVFSNQFRDTRTISVQCSAFKCQTVRLRITLYVWIALHLSTNTFGTVWPPRTCFRSTRVVSQSGVLLLSMMSRLLNKPFKIRAWAETSERVHTQAQGLDFQKSPQHNQG